MTTPPPPKHGAADYQSALFAISEDADDEGGHDVQHYPLPPAFLAAAQRILGPSEVEHILNGPAKGAYYLDSKGQRVYVTKKP